VIETTPLLLKLLGLTLAVAALAIAVRRLR